MLQSNLGAGTCFVRSAAAPAHVEHLVDARDDSVRVCCGHGTAGNHARPQELWWRPGRCSDERRKPRALQKLRVHCRTARH
jgi:hypothetical protein